MDPMGGSIQISFCHFTSSPVTSITIFIVPANGLLHFTSINSCLPRCPLVIKISHVHASKSQANMLASSPPVPDLISRIISSNLLGSFGICNRFHHGVTRFAPVKVLISDLAITRSSSSPSIEHFFFFFAPLSSAFHIVLVSYTWKQWVVVFLYAL